MNYTMMIRLTVILAASLCVAEQEISTRIVGGNNVTIAQFPYQVALVINDLNCGGVIISKKWVLTAAHCFRNPNSVVHSGTTFYDTGSVHNIVRTEIHSKFDYKQGFPVNDMALIEVSPEFIYTYNVRPAKLPSKWDDVDEQSRVVISGWGRLSENGPFSLRLQSVEVDVISNQRCKMLYRNNTILQNNFCTMMRRGGKGPCFGDSGGPATSEDGVVVGIVSWGKGCAGFNLPGVFTKVASFRDWITNVTGV